jgi:putative PIN family toxin of toxin-antitoxin system
MKPKVVLDTNILLDLFYFKDQSVEGLLNGLVAHKITAYTCADIWAELEEVLARKPFNQTWEQIKAIRDLNSSLFEWLTPVVKRSGIKCSDPDDQIFIELAVTVAPCYLITKDKDLLRLSKRLLQANIQTLKKIDDDLLQDN